MTLCKDVPIMKNLQHLQRTAPLAVNYPDFYWRAGWLVSLVIVQLIESFAFTQTAPSAINRTCVYETLHILLNCH